MPGSHAAPQLGHGSSCHDCGSFDGCVRRSDQKALSSIAPACPSEGRRSERIHGRTCPIQGSRIRKPHRARFRKPVREEGPRLAAGAPPDLVGCDGLTHSRQWQIAKGLVSKGSCLSPGIHERAQRFPVGYTNKRPTLTPI